MYARFWMKDRTGRLHPEERSTWDDIDTQGKRF